jgi:lactate dehydrogenase-like 2-hydroxyacid dehydrogenase
MASSKTIGIIGYGDIGCHVAKLAKNGFNMKVIGLKRNPKSISLESQKYLDTIVGNDGLDYLLE